MDGAAALSKLAEFDAYGAAHFPEALSEADVPALLHILAHLPPDSAGSRLHGIPALSPFLTPDGPIGRVASDCLGRPGMVVRAILFDKRAATNWALGWHQDRTICVLQRIAVPGFGPWTVKAGLLHVAPPFALLERMVTLRIHLDPVDADNAPLLIAPGSHAMGRVAEADVAAAVDRYGIATCLVETGDIWAYATPILHASEAAHRPRRRRVLQVDFSADPLPGGLEWLGV